MSNKLFALSIFAAVAFNTAVSAEEGSQSLKIVKMALNNINSLDYQAAQNFRFTKTITSENGSRRIHFDPVLGSSSSTQWTLLSLDGEVPSLEQRQQYQYEVMKYKKQQRQEIEASKGNPLLKLLDVDSLELARAGELQRQYRFKVNDKKYRAYISGLITLQNDCQCIVSIDVSKPEAFSPQFMVKIEEYQERYTFIPLAGVGSVVSRIDKRIIGRALLTDLSQHYFEVYSDVGLLKKIDDSLNETVVTHTQRE